VPRNLCAKIPDRVDDESAAFTVLAAVGLQGFAWSTPVSRGGRRLRIGLVGLMTVQMLRANGCRVLGIDVDAAGARWLNASEPKP